MNQKLELEELLKKSAAFCFSIVLQDDYGYDRDIDGL